jgi:hypothetical protein
VSVRSLVITFSYASGSYSSGSYGSGTATLGNGENDITIFVLQYSGVEIPLFLLSGYYCRLGTGYLLDSGTSFSN